MTKYAKTKRFVGGSILLTAALALMAGPASALDVCLVAKPFTKNVPDGNLGGANIPMWGYAEVTYSGVPGDPNNCDWASAGIATASAPGPQIDVLPTDSVLDIHLRNMLPTGTPTSLVIPGQIAPLAPVWVEPGDPLTTYATRTTDTMRIRSVGAETMPGNVGSYSWTGVAAGSYLYRTGTHPQVQVQMGLSGAMVKDHAAGEAYPGVAYADEVLLVYSEIDPALHAAVDAGTYGTGAMTSTIDYQPKFFLINGEPYDAAVSGSNEYPVTQNTSALVRMVNAGLRSHVPTLLGARLSMVAEDGNPYPFARSQVSALLPAGTTRDAVVMSPSAGRLPLLDRSMDMTNAGAGTGGALAFLVAAAATPLTAAADAYPGAVEDTALIVAAGAGVLFNDSPNTGETAVLVDDVQVAKGSLSLAADGSFTYAPAADFNGTAEFTYRAETTTQVSNVATVTITVAGTADAPVAAADGYGTEVDTVLNVAAPGVLGNDNDADGDALQAAHVALSGPANGLLVLNTDGSFTYTPNLGYTGPDGFQYTASDGLLTDVATVTISVNPPPANQAPVAVDDTATTQKTVAKIINVLINDSDADGTLDPLSVTIVDPPHRKGTATPNADGTITYTPFMNFRGTELFTYTVMDNLGEISNKAEVKVNVVK